MKRPCPECGKTLEKKIVDGFETQFEGISLVVPKATFFECNECGERTFSARELKKWKGIKEEFIAASGVTVNGNDVRVLRGRLGQSVAQFSDLISVTRQSVHNWEKELQKSLKMSPTSLLISLLIKEIDSPSQVSGVSNSLVDLATIQGKVVPIEVHATRTNKRPTTGPRLKCDPPEFPRFYNPEEEAA